MLKHVTASMSSHCNKEIKSNNLSLPWQNNCMRFFENGKKSSVEEKKHVSMRPYFINDYWFHIFNNPCEMYSFCVFTTAESSERIWAMNVNLCKFKTMWPRLLFFVFVCMI